MIDTKKMEVERSAVGRAAAGARHGPRRRERHDRRAAADRRELRRGRARRLRAAGCDRAELAARARRADAILQHEGRRNVEQAEIEREEAAEIYGEEAEEEVEAEKAASPVQRKPKDWELIGRVPTASYPTWAGATSRKRKLVWVTAKGAGSGPELARGRARPCRDDPGSATGGAPESFWFKYLPVVHVRPLGRPAVPVRPAAAQADAARVAPDPPDERAGAAGRHAAQDARQGGKFKHVFYIVRENRTYDQILGADPRGDGDPKLELFGEDDHAQRARARRALPAARPRLRELRGVDRRPLLDLAAAPSPTTSSKNWHANYGGRTRPYDFGTYSVTWPAAGFLFDQAQKQGISWFNFGEAIAGVVPLKDDDRTPEETERVVAKFRKSDLGTTPGFLRPFLVVDDTGAGLLPERRVVGRRRRGAVRRPGPRRRGLRLAAPAAGRRPDAGGPGLIGAVSLRLLQAEVRAAAGGRRRAAVHLHRRYANDHTAGTTPGRRTPNAMIAENDWALGETVELISKSPIWKDSLILVIEDDSQDGADHVDAHRIPALAISPYAERGRGRPHALRLPVVHPHARDRDRDEAAQPVRRARGAAVRRLHADAGQRSSRTRRSCRTWT